MDVCKQDNLTIGSEIVGHKGWMSGQQDDEPQYPTLLLICTFIPNHTLCDMSSTDRHDAFLTGNPATGFHALWC